VEFTNFAKNNGRSHGVPVNLWDEMILTRKGRGLTFFNLTRLCPMGINRTIHLTMGVLNINNSSLKKHLVIQLQHSNPYIVVLVWGWFFSLSSCFFAYCCAVFVCIICCNMNDESNRHRQGSCQKYWNIQYIENQYNFRSVAGSKRHKYRLNPFKPPVSTEF